MAAHGRREEALTLVQKLKDSLGAGSGGQPKQAAANKPLPNYGNRSVHLRQGKLRDGEPEDPFGGGGRRLTRRDTDGTDSGRSRGGGDDDLYKTTQVLDVVDTVPLSTQRSLPQDTLNGRWRPNIGLGFGLAVPKDDRLEDLDRLKSPAHVGGATNRNRSVYQTLMSLGSDGFENEKMGHRFGPVLPPSAPPLDLDDWRPSTQQSLATGKISALSNVSSDSKLTIDDDTQALCEKSGSDAQKPKNSIAQGAKVAIPWFLLGLLVGFLLMFLISMTNWKQEKCECLNPVENDLGYNNTKRGDDACAKADSQKKNYENMATKCRQELSWCKGLSGIVDDDDDDDDDDDISPTNKPYPRSTGENDVDDPSFAPGTPDYDDTSVNGNGDTSVSSFYPKPTRDSKTADSTESTDNRNHETYLDHTTSVPSFESRRKHNDSKTVPDESLEESATPESSQKESSDHDTSDDSGESDSTRSNSNRPFTKSPSSATSGDSDESEETTGSDPSRYITKSPSSATSGDTGESDETNRSASNRYSTDSTSSDSSAENVLQSTEASSNGYGLTKARPSTGAFSDEDSNEVSTKFNVGATQSVTASEEDSSGTAADSDEGAGSTLPNPDTSEESSEVTTTVEDISNSVTTNPDQVPGNVPTTEAIPPTSDSRNRSRGGTSEEMDSDESTVLIPESTIESETNSKTTESAIPESSEESLEGNTGGVLKPTPSSDDDDVEKTFPPPTTTVKLPAEPGTAAAKSSEEDVSGEFVPGSTNSPETVPVENLKKGDKYEDNGVTRSRNPRDGPNGSPGSVTKATTRKTTRKPAAAEEPPDINSGAGSSGKRRKQKGWFQRFLEVVKDVISSVTPFQVKSRDDGNLGIEVQ